MDDEQFQELFLAVHKKDIWVLRQDRVEKILKELLNGEFRDEIQERRFLIRIRKLKGNCSAQVFKKLNPVIIDLNSERWKWKPGLNDHDIRETLRHELLHVATNRDDDDPLFELEAKRRNININSPWVK